MYIFPMLLVCCNSRTAFQQGIQCSEIYKYLHAAFWQERPCCSPVWILTRRQSSVGERQLPHKLSVKPHTWAIIYIRRRQAALEPPFPNTLPLLSGQSTRHKGAAWGLAGFRLFESLVDITESSKRTKKAQGGKDRPRDRGAILTDQAGRAAGRDGWKLFLARGETGVSTPSTQVHFHDMPPGHQDSWPGRLVSLGWQQGTKA